LSSCQTAVGDDRAALGLAGIAIKAGARSALATLWMIYDPAAAVLVPEFYRHLRDPRVSKAEALRRAQLAVLQDERLAHPAYWAPYLMIGNWL
jgi:CHAT domain-containing protein